MKFLFARVITSGMQTDLPTMNLRNLRMSEMRQYCDVISIPMKLTAA